MIQIFSKQEVTPTPFNCNGAFESLKYLLSDRDRIDAKISANELFLQKNEAEIKTDKKTLKDRNNIVCGDLEKLLVERAGVDLAFLSFPCYNSLIVCPLLFYREVSLANQINVVQECLDNFKKFNEELESKIAEKEQKSKDLRAGLINDRNNRNDRNSDITEVNSEITSNGCYGPLPFIKGDTKLAECNKSKERIEKLKAKYFKSSKDINDIKFGLNGIRFLKINKKSLIKLKPMIEEVIEKGEDLKRYVIETDDEKAFLTLHSSNKVILAQNINEQSMIEANLKNLLIKKEKTNRILKRTKKLLDLKIKQTIKFCNDRKFL
jgi:hypothetical protein